MKPFLVFFAVFVFGMSAANAEIVRNVQYGPDKDQSMDIYLPEHAQNAPVIFMVHGGGWRHGDKAMSRVVDNKSARWVPLGFIFVSVNYPMLPESGVEAQAENVARALATAQKSITQYGGDKDKFTLMGHSAGAHLVSLINANPDLAYHQGAIAWLGTVSLDSAAMNVATVMKSRHPKLYDDAFGSLSEAQWKSLSPYYVLNAKARPWMGVCSTQRDTSCTQSDAFVEKAKSLNVKAHVIRENLSHGEINAMLGLPNEYTKSVENFMASLHPDVAKLLSVAPAANSPTKTEKGDHPLRDRIRQRIMERRG